MQKRIADIKKRQLKRSPTEEDVAKSLGKRAVLAMSKLRFGRSIDDKERGYYNLRRKHVIGFDRLASRITSRGMGASQDVNDILTRVMLLNATQNNMIRGQERELRQELNIPKAFSSIEEVERLEAEAEDRDDIRQVRFNIADYDDDEFEEIAGMIDPEKFTRKFTELQREAYSMSPSVAARAETDKKNEMMVMRSRSYSKTEVPTQRKKPEQTSIPIQFAVSNRGVTTSGVYNPNDRKIRKTKNYKDASIFQVDEESLQSPVVTKKRV